jgi:MerR family transcriptional regulator, light-induced transcriptional regulator
MFVASINHSMRIVCDKTGLSAHVLRAWERRYAAITPSRTSGNQRLYSDEDVARLLLLKRAVDSGRRIGDIAGLSTGELRELLETERTTGTSAFQDKVGAAATDPERREEDSREIATNREERELLAGGFVREALTNLLTRDQQALRATLSRATVDLGIEAVLDLVISPLMRETGEGWRRGDLRIYQEHMATETVRSFLGTLLDRAEPVPGGVVAVAATPSRQMHEIGALLAAVSVVLEGQKVVYLGPNVPPHELIRACEVFDADLLLLSVSYPAHDDRLVDELHELSLALRGRTRIILGGSSAAVYAERAVNANLDVVTELKELRARLTRTTTKA